MQTWYSKAKHSGLNKANFKNTATEKYQKLKSKCCSPKSMHLQTWQTINKYLPLLLQTPTASQSPRTPRWGRYTAGYQGQMVRSSSLSGASHRSSGKAANTTQDGQSLGLVPTISSQVVVTQCNLQVPLNCQVFLSVYKHQLLESWF